jgi:hypothetical protein
MLYIFLVENCPWCLWCDLTGDLTRIGKRIGEWAWVGREYRDEDYIPSRWSAIGGREC